MISIPKVVGVLACGFLLCLGLSNTAQSGQPASPADPAVRKGGQAGVRGEQGKLKGGHRIEGDVLRVEAEHYFVMGQDGEEVRLHTDRSTKMTGNISQGARIVANVDDQNHARSIRVADMADMTDRRYNNADRTTDSTFESGKASLVGQ
ncbi:MAG: hypothetical protein ABIQ24_09760 [Nitrospiraceae bacterium]